MAKTRRPKIQGAKAARAHAKTLMNIPAGEQWIGHVQTVLAAALNDIAAWIEQHDHPRPTKARR